MNPYFSIIIPTYNSEKLIEFCIKSLIIQTYHNFEVIFIDNDSKDKTLSIIEKYKNKLPKVILKSEKDYGIYYAMNKGIKLASGKWLYFLGSDDSLYDENVLEKIFKYTYNKDIDVIYGNVLSPLWKSKYIGEVNEKSIYSTNICHQAIFFKNRIFKKFGFYNTRYKVYADWEFNFRWMLSPFVKRKYVDEIIANFGDNGTCTFVVDNLFLMEKYYLYTKYLFFNRFHNGYICLKHYLKNRKMLLVLKTLLLFPKFLALCFIKISKQ